MKKIISILLCMVMVLSLCACDFAKDIIDLTVNDTAVAKTFECGSLSLELNSDFLTMDFVDDNYEFIWGTEDVTIMGLMTEFEQDVLDNMTALDYATLFREQISDFNPSEISNLDGIPIMEYTNAGDDGDVTFLLTFYEATDGIWLVMFGADADVYSEHYTSFCEYAKTVRCN